MSIMSSSLYYTLIQILINEDTIFTRGTFNSREKVWEGTLKNKNNKDHRLTLIFKKTGQQHSLFLQIEYYKTTHYYSFRDLDFKVWNALLNVFLDKYTNIENQEKIIQILKDVFICK